MRHAGRHVECIVAPRSSGRRRYHTVDPTDIYALADAMSQALQDTSLRQQMIDRGLARAAEFTWLRAASQLRQVYQQLAAQA